MTKKSVVISPDFIGPVQPVKAPRAKPVETKSLVAQLVEQVVEAKVEEVKEKSEKNEGVGLFIRKLISEGLGNKQILDIVHEQYGNKNTTYACVAWYRNKMKKSGQEVSKASNLDWLQNFAKAHNLDENCVEELAKKIA